MGPLSGSLTDAPARVKLEEFPHTTSFSKLQEGRSVASVGKLKRESAEEYMDLDFVVDSDDEFVPQRSKKDNRISKHNNKQLQPKARNRKSLIARYQNTCRYFREEAAKLLDATSAPDKILRELYKQSQDLIIHMKAEYDERQGELVELRDAGRKQNAKIKFLKSELKEERVARKAVEVEARLDKDSMQDASLQWTLRSAQPSYQQQTKIEDTAQNHVNQMAELRAKLADERKAKESALRISAVAEQELVDMQKLNEGAATSVNQLTTISQQLKSRVEDLEAQNNDLRTKVSDTLVVAQRQAAAETNGLREEIENLRMRVREQDDLLKEQKATVAAFESCRRIFQAT